jgi:hypothetical protein
MSHGVETLPSFLNISGWIMSRISHHDFPAYLRYSSFPIASGASPNNPEHPGNAIASRSLVTPALYRSMFRVPVFMRDTFAGPGFDD